MRAKERAGDRKLIFGVALMSLSCAKLGLAVFRAFVQSVPRAIRRLPEATSHP